MRLTIITLLLVFMCSSCVNTINTAVRMAAYPKWEPHYKVVGEKVFHLFPNAAGGSKILLVGADAKTFEQLSSEWGKDKNFVYRQANRVEGLEPSSFKAPID